MSIQGRVPSLSRLDSDLSDPRASLFRWLCLLSFSLSLANMDGGLLRRGALPKWILAGRLSFCRLWAWRSCLKAHHRCSGKEEKILSVIMEVRIITQAVTTTPGELGAQKCRQCEVGAKSLLDASSRHSHTPNLSPPLG